VAWGIVLASPPIGMGPRLNTRSNGFLRPKDAGELEGERNPSPISGFVAVQGPQSEDYFFESVGHSRVHDRKKCLAVAAASARPNEPYAVPRITPRGPTA